MFKGLGARREASSSATQRFQVHQRQVSVNYSPYRTCFVRVISRRTLWQCKVLCSLKDPREGCFRRTLVGVSVNSQK